MMRKSMSIGISAGLLLTALALYPAVAVMLPTVFSGWKRPIANDIVHTLVLGVLALAVAAVLLVFGALAALRAGACSPLPGAKAGLVSGVVAGAIFFLLVVSPLNGLIGMADLMVYTPTPEVPFPPESLMTPFRQQIFSDSFLLLEVALLVGGLIGAFSGLIGGFLAAGLKKPERRSLFQSLHSRHARREWFAQHNDSFRAGVWSGLVYGAIISASIKLVIEWRHIGPGTISMPEAMAREFSLGLLGLAPPVLWLGMIFVGVFAVLLVKNPPDRFFSRLFATLVALQVSGFVFLLFASPSLNYWIGSMPFGACEEQAGEAVVAALRTPPFLAFAAFLFPLGALVLIVIAQNVVGLALGAFYAWLLPLFVKRPVDYAHAVRRRLRVEKNMLLPAIYQHFGAHANADDMLVHLALAEKSKRPDVARLAAAYHALCTDGETVEEAISLVREVLGRWPQWRWSPEVGELYLRLDTILSAKTIEQVMVLSPTSTRQSGTLPPLLRQVNDRFSDVLVELHKVERVEDLSSKVIFLNCAVDEVRQMQQFAAEGMAALATPYPERQPLEMALDHWQGVLLETMRRLRGRARINAELLGERYTFAPEIPLTIRLTNEGLNVAQNLRLSFAPAEGWEIADHGPLPVAILPPGESRDLTVNITPESAGRLRVEWQVIYDDAIDESRALSFAGVVEFTQEAKPFQRIFPNPYVTGTPLKTGDLFVGREDVFRYVRDNLVGAYQNNVIVLHGQRRSGKTSILYRLKEEMAETHLAVLVDMQGKPARGTADFLYSIADDIAYELEDEDILADLPERAEFDKAPEFTFRNRFLRQTCDLLGERNLLLMFDEFEELQRRVEAGRLNPDIFPYLRNLMQHEERVDFLFTGTHKLEELAAEYWSILFNIAAYKKISFLEPADVKKLIEEPVAAYGMEYDPLAIESIRRATAGHPYFTQVVLHEMVDHHNESGDTYHTNTCVKQVLERIVERGEAHFKFIWAESNLIEQIVLLAMAELLAGDAGACTAEDVSSLLAGRGRDIPPAELAAGLDQLEARDILGRSGPRSPLYHFRIDLIRLWIDRTRPGL